VTIFVRFVCVLSLLTSLPAFGDPAEDLQAVRARGEYLTRVMDCGACHTPSKLGPSGPEPDASRLLSGHPAGSPLPAPPTLAAGPWNVVTAGNTAWAGPWGVSYSSNLTSDEDTGIGAWTEEMFAGSLRGGDHLGMGRRVLPPMPRYPDLTNEDLHAIFVYLQHTPPIRNRVPEPQPPLAP